MEKKERAREKMKKQRIGKKLKRGTEIINASIEQNEMAFSSPGNAREKGGLKKRFGMWSGSEWRGVDE